MKTYRHVIIWLSIFSLLLAAGILLQHYAPPAPAAGTVQYGDGF